MSPYNLVRALLVITGVVALSAIAPHVAAARPNPTPTPPCASVPCSGECLIAPSCTPGGACPDFRLLGQCTEDASGSCQCVAVQAPSPTPTPTPTVCVDTELCIIGFHWSPTQCQCVPDNPEPTPTICVDNVLCIRGTHWSPTQCRCVPDRGPHTPHAPSGPHSPHAIQAPHQPHTPG
jgi:hypothetical protein